MPIARPYVGIVNVESDGGILVCLFASCGGPAMADEEVNAESKNNGEDG